VTVQSALYAWSAVTLLADIVLLFWVLRDVHREAAGGPLPALFARGDALPVQAQAWIVIIFALSNIAMIICGMGLALWGIIALVHALS
jgi:hypothetical protein